MMIMPMMTKKNKKNKNNKKNNNKNMLRLAGHYDVDSGEPHAAKFDIFPAGRIQPNLPGALGSPADPEEARDACGTGRIARLALSAVGYNAVAACALL